MLTCITFSILYWLCGSHKYYESILCENSTLNISCQNDSFVEIQDVQFGPLSIENEEFGNKQKAEGPTLNETNFRTLCNDRNYCYLIDSNEYNFDKYPSIPRLIHINYTCDFEYVGCYTDYGYPSRLFTDGLIKQWNNMSASICRNFCSTRVEFRPHFGTEFEAECYCGYEGEINKLNKTVNYRKYELQDTKECNSYCQGHEYEKCGRNGLISVYTTIAVPKYTRVKVEEVAIQRCSFNSSIKTMHILSYQRAKLCERAEMEDYKDYNFDENSCWVNRYLPFVAGYLDNYLSKYVIINYTCNVPQTDKNKSLGSVYDAETTNAGLIIGIVCSCGVLLLLVIIIGLCKIKRKFQNTDATGLTSIQNVHAGHYDDLESRNNVRNYDDLARAADYDEIQEENKYTTLQAKEKEPDYDDLSNHKQ